MNEPRRHPAGLPAVALALLICTACEDTPATSPVHPLIVIGVDGAEWTVIEDLWSRGRLPALRYLHDHGVATHLETAYGKSPVIWTTIATGVTPDRHGVTDYVVRTPEGDVPITSTVRRVPALWNMASRSGKRAAMLGWLVTWPAEAINGVIVSERPQAADGVSPASETPRFKRILDAAGRAPGRFALCDEVGVQDQAMADAARRLAAEDFDILLVYFRSVDVICHHYWKYYQPEKFEAVPVEEIEAYRDRIPLAYEAVDAAIGRILEAGGSKVNYVVMSDHGFQAAPDDQPQIHFDLSALLEHLGYAARKRDNQWQVDLTRTRVFSLPDGMPSFRTTLPMRFALAGREAGGRVRPEQRASIRAALEADLERVTYAGGDPVFRVRSASGDEIRGGTDFVLELQTARASRRLLVKGEPFDEAVLALHTVSGGHPAGKAGIFIATGPDIDREAKMAGITIHDIAPTLLFGMDLPAARDFDGKPWTRLFNARFREAHPLRWIQSWGSRRAGPARTAPDDDQLVEQLRSLGYIE